MLFKDVPDSAMPHFFFDFCQGPDHCIDAQGTEFGSVEDAYLGAFQAAQDMWSELLRKRQDPRRCFFEARNAEREVLFALPFQEVMDSCHDRALPPIHNMVERVIASAQRTRRVTVEFQETLHAVKNTLADSRALLQLK
jgi:hypothetical protein